MPLPTNMFCKRARVYQQLIQKLLGINFLFVSKNHIKSALKIPVATFCRLITQQTLPELAMEAVWHLKVF